MITHIRSLTLLLLATLSAPAWAQLQPIVSNVQVGQRAGTKLVDITYDLAYAGGPVTVWMEISNDGGRSFIVPAKTFSGHIGQNVQPGTGRVAVWNAEADFDGMLAEQMRVRVNARAGSIPVPPPHMVYIPGGHFYMGEWVGGSSASARQIYISPFFMDRYEVSGAMCADVINWSFQNGYNDLSSGSSRALDHPVHSVNWYYSVKWCNARSEKEGLTPVYYTDTAHTIVYRTGNVDLTNAMVKWDANGYRLPTEAEWEKAARGGLSGKLYPWGNTIDGSMANYSGSVHPWSAGSVSTAKTAPVGYYNGNQQGGGTDMANGYGIYDVVGNVWEFCWDRQSSNPVGENDPRGPSSSGISSRILRGGSWSSPASGVLCAIRDSGAPTGSAYNIGFRCARRF